MPVAQDSAAQILSGTAHGAPGMHWSIAVYVPDDFSLGPPFELRDSAYTVAAERDDVVRVKFGFRDTDLLKWSLPFKPRRGAVRKVPTPMPLDWTPSLEKALFY
jgi:hypothetical protein